MTICYFGIYNPKYCRNRNIIIGLKENGVKVIEVNERMGRFKKYWRLIKKHQEIKDKYDLMIVGFPGHIVMPLAKLICRKPIIFDVHLSYYDSLVYNWGKIKKNSLQALWYFFLDWFSCRLADVVLLDTKSHIKYFVKKFKIPESKFIVVYHGADDSLFSASHKFRQIDNQQKDEFIVEFHAYFTRLHGLKYVIQAIDILKGEKIKLWVIGRGEEYKKAKVLVNKLGLNNVVFYPVLPPLQLVKQISKADLGIGILGDTDKVDRVIPNKLYELVALRIPVLTADSPAVREKFSSKDLALCPKATPQAIARTIKLVKDDIKLRLTLINNSYIIFKKDLIPKAVGRQLLDHLKDKIKYLDYK